MANVSLRYFGVAGAGSDLLGDTSVANLIPMALRATTSDKRPMIFGTDYPTDGTPCIRDYIHVVDLARSHVAAAELCERDSQNQLSELFNVGRGSGSSVHEVLAMVSVLDTTLILRTLSAAKAICGARRAHGEDRTGARRKAELDLRDMVQSAWSAWRMPCHFAPSCHPPRNVAVS